jgi:hypothetical protein
MANKNRITQIANKIRKRFNKNYYEGFLLYESDFVEFLKDNDVKVVRRRLKFPLLSMEVMYFCEV